MVTKQKSNKAIQVKGSEAEDVIEDYLNSNKKPFAINDIILNLHNKVSRPETLKALENLNKENKISSRIFGKIIIYSSKDTPINFENEFNESTQHIDDYSHDKLIQLREEFMEIERDKNSLKKELEVVQKDISNSNLLEKLELLQSEVDSKSLTLRNIENSRTQDNEVQTKQIVKSKNSFEKQIKIRKRYFDSLLNIIKEQIKPKNLNEFFEEICVELPI